MEVPENHHCENEFFKLMNECKKAAGTNLETLSSSLLQLKSHLERMSDMKNLGAANTNSSAASLPFQEFATALLELETVRTGSSSEKRIQDIIHHCLDLCGHQAVLLAALNILRDRSKPEKHALKDTLNSASAAPIISSTNALKRLLLAIPDTVYKYNGGEEDVSRPRCYCLLEEFVSDWKDMAITTNENVTFSMECAINAFINLIIPIPTQIANACYSNRIQLLTWATRPIMFSRLLECSATIALLSERGTYRCLEGNQIEEARMEGAYCACLLEKLVYLGSCDSASSGMYKFLINSANEADAAHVLMKACSRIKSPRLAASLLCSNIKHTISEIEMYSDGMSANQADSLCKNHCMPYIKNIWLPILQASSIIRDAFVQLAILAPSPTADEGEIKLLVRCVVILLALCNPQDGDGGSVSDSDSESSRSEGERFDNDILMASLAEVVTVWNGSSFINTIDTSQQCFVSYFIMYAIEFMDKDNHSHSQKQQMVAREIVIGVTNRLKVSEASVRVNGMQVAELLAPILGQPLHFEELDNIRDDEGPKVEMPEEIATEGKENKTSTRKNRPRRVATKRIDPDEDYYSDDDSSLSSAHDDNEDNGSVYSSDSDWNEEDLAILQLDDDEDDLRVVAKPNYLRECLDLLRSDGDDHEAVCKQESALKEIPILVRDMPPDLIDVNVSLANELFHLENKFNLEEFDRLRLDGLYSLAGCEPVTTVEYLQSQIFTEISMGKRFDILEVMKNAASELSGQQELKSYRKSLNGNDRVMSKVSGKRRLIGEGDMQKKYNNGETLDSIAHSTISEIKTRRWGRGRHAVRDKRVTNRFGPVAPVFFYPLVHGFLSSKSNEVLWGGESGGTLLSHLLVTLSFFVEQSGFHPGTAILAKEMIDLSWPLFVAENSEVRQAVLIALATCLPHLPEDYILQVIIGQQSIPHVLAKAIAMDANENCRILASAIQDGLQRSIMF